MYDKQAGLCRMCSEPLPQDYRKAHIDHDHVTKAVRGLLHQRCNIVVGYLEHEMFEKAKTYIAEFE